MLSASCAPITFIRCYMTKKSILLILLIAVVPLAGCQQQRVRIATIKDESFVRTFAALQSYQVSQIDLDYSAKCRIRIKTPTLDENGVCQIVITRDNHFSITVFSPVGGTLLMVYQDEVQIQVLNYHDKTYLQLKNSEKNRDKAFEIVNLNVAEFRSIFWGREIDEEDTRLRFRYKGEKPVQIRKPTRHSDQLVTIKKWLSYQGAWFPRTIEFEDRRRQIFLKVVITSFAPGLTDKLVPAEGPENFQIKH